MSGDVTDRSWIQAGAWRDWFTILLLYGPFESTATAVTIVVALLDRYADCDGVFVLECSGSLEVNGVKTLIEFVYNLLIEPIQLSSFFVLEFVAGRILSNLLRESERNKLWNLFHEVICQY